MYEKPNTKKELYMKRYIFWNNKGGTGKTSLAFQSVCHFANKNPNHKILVIDLCPQANLSELFLGGQENSGIDNLLRAHGSTPRRSVGGYFDNRLSSPFSPVGFNTLDYILTPSEYNNTISPNIDIITGDPLVELQSIAMNTLANTKVPGVNTWMSVMDWVNDLLKQIEDQYDYVFIDSNPSFSIYTQIALASSDFVIAPVMADDSSRRALQNALSLIYGIRLPSPIYKEYTFAKLMSDAGRKLPKIHLIVRNRITQYMGEASAYSAVLDGINKDLSNAINENSSYFSFSDPSEGSFSMRDFQTTGVVAFARGCPFYNMKPGKLTLTGRRVQVQKDHLEKVKESLDKLVDKL